MGCSAAIYHDFSSNDQIKIQNILKSQNCKQCQCAQFGISIRFQCIFIGENNKKKSSITFCFNGRFRMCGSKTIVVCSFKGWLQTVCISVVLCDAMMQTVRRPFLFHSHFNVLGCSFRLTHNDRDSNTQSHTECWVAFSCYISFSEFSFACNEQLWICSSQMEFRQTKEYARAVLYFSFSFL